MIVEPSKECKNERSQEVQVLRKGVHSKEWIAEVLLRGVPDESERGRADEADRFQSQADIDKPEVRVMVNPGGLNEKFANENLTHATIIVWQKNEEIPNQVAEGNADVMITEITEAPWYVQNDPRLAAPLIETLFTHGEIGVLMRKGQDDLLVLVNAVIAQMKADGTLRQFHEKYGLVYGYE